MKKRGRKKKTGKKKNDKKRFDEKEIKRIISSVIFGLVMVFIIWLLFAYPYFIKIRFFRFLIFSLTIMLPLIFKSVLGVLGVPVPRILFYIISFVVYSCLFYLILKGYEKQKYRKIYLSMIIILVIIFVGGSVIFLSM
ncbi:hypothetical protein GF386_03640 [Candidatus Pacearchaeota archaeon]|nr:hypothetical protein [Candidatus Pacearchaeota archaeon]MBD3283244.1 hypothetical protein [Candidatus Pacearchaeota archaeon]